MKRAFSALKLIGSSTFALGLFACSTYDVKVNDNVVYSPPPLFSDYQVEDPSLKECVRATIREQKTTNAKQLQRLSCPAGEIKSLAGLELFLNMSHLGLRGNQVRNIDALSKMRRLQQLDIRDNQLLSVESITSLEKLSSLQLSGNTELDCDSVKKLKGSVKTILPEHCL